MSCCLVFGFDAVLAEHVPQPLHLAAQPLDLFGQGRQVRVAGLPLVLAGGLVGEQLPFAVAQRTGLLEVLGVNSCFLVPPHLRDLLVEVGGAGPGPTRCSIADSRDSSAVTRSETSEGTRPRRSPPGAAPGMGSLPW
jgi:hypothetical protein